MAVGMGVNNFFVASAAPEKDEQALGHRAQLLAGQDGTQGTNHKYYRNRLVHYHGHVLLKICEVPECEVRDILKSVDE